jgi:hypothetical protein
MRTVWRSMAAACLLGAALAAQDSAPSRPASRPDPATPAGKLAAIEAEYADATKAFSEAYRAAKTQDDKDKLIEEKSPKAETWYPRLMELAKSGADETVTVSALAWVVSHGAQTPAGKEAVGLLAQNHLKSPDIKKVFGVFARNPGRAGEKFLRAALEQNPSEEVQAQAAYSLSQLLKSRADVAANYDKSNADQQKAFEKRFDAEDRALLTSLDATANAKEIEKLLEKAGEMAAGKPWGKKLAESAEGDLFEIRNLAMGMTAPDIVAEGLDGKPMKLSDFKGKVVVLDFWGHW